MIVILSILSLLQWQGSFETKNCCIKTAIIFLSNHSLLYYLSLFSLLNTEIANILAEMTKRTRETLLLKHVISTLLLIYGVSKQERECVHEWK